MEWHKVKLTSLIAPAFYPVHNKVIDSNYDAFWLKGGRGSTKSSFAAIEIIRGMMADPEANAIAIRKVDATVRTSVLETLLWAINKLEVDHLWRHTVSPAEITYIPTGQKILCKGLDDPKKLKSIKLKKGYFKYLWFEELEEFGGMKEIRSVEQSILRGGSRFIEFFTYNPPIDPQSWVNQEAEAKRPRGRYVHESTYLEVPKDWLGSRFIEDAEWLKENNPLSYEHEYMGVATGLHDAIIFAGKYRIADFEPEAHWDGPYFGADWGFSTDPSTIVKCWIEVLPSKRMKLYIEYAAFGHKIELDDYPEFYKPIPGSDKYDIMADSSQPATISHVASKGFKVKAADKWPGSVEDGITVLKGFEEIVIHTRCKEMQQEARLYSYKIDRITKAVTADVVDKFNHGWDAVRYALSKFIIRKPKGFFDV